MEQEKRMSALEVALNNELREREFYLKNAERTKNQLGKKMFEQIAAEELEHYQRLKELHERWKEQQRWPETVPLVVKNTIVRDVLVEFIKKIDKAPHQTDPDDVSALRIAIDFEAKGASYYAELRDSVLDPKEKDFFDLLSRIENEHYLSLKDTEEYLTDPASWYRRIERHTFDGG